jgi:tetratricopeptide (TPR) repeat protein
LILKFIKYVLIVFTIASKIYANDAQNEVFKRIDQIKKDPAISPDEKASQLLSIKKEGQDLHDIRVELAASCAILDAYINLRRFNEARKIIEDYLPIATKLALKKEQYYLLRAKLNITKTDKDVIESEKIIKKLEKLVASQEDQELYASVNLDIAQAYAYYNKLKDSLRFAYEALRVFEGLNNKKGASVALNTIGNAYIDLREYEKAIAEFKIALNIANEMGDQFSAAIYQSNIGNCYFSLGYEKKALRYFLQSYGMSKKLNDDAGMAYTGKYLGAIYMQMKKLETAQQYYKDAYEIYEKLGDKEGWFEAAVSLFSVYSSLNMDKKAEDVISKIDQSTISLARTSAKQEYYKSRYTHEKKKENFKSALNFLELYLELFAERAKQQRDETVQELIVKYEADRKEIENKLLQKDNAIAAERILKKEKEANRLAILLVFSCLVFASIIILIRISIRKTKLLHVERLNSEIRSRSLVDQMRPHFLFNSLNAISYLVYDSAEKASQAIYKLADLYRLILESTNSHTWKFSKEISLVEDYLDLQIIRFDDRVKYSIEYENVDVEKIEFPCLMLHTLVENSFKHALSLNIDGGYINIKISASSGGYSITVEDSGSGKAATGGVMGTGTGLENTRKRLLNMYGKKSRFSTYFSSHGSRVSFWISG